MSLRGIEKVTAMANKPIWWDVPWALTPYDQELSELLVDRARRGLLEPLAVEPSEVEDHICILASCDRTRLDGSLRCKTHQLARNGYTFKRGLEKWESIGTHIERVMGL